MKIETLADKSANAVYVGTSVIFLIFVIWLTLSLISTAGCITMARNIIPAAEPVTVDTPIPEITEMIVLAETDPTPEPYIEPPELRKYREGGRALGDWFEFRRDDVSGTKDLSVKTTVYRYQFLDNYRWWSVSWGRYFTQVPSDGNKYLIISVCHYMEGKTTNEDPRMWGMNQDHFVVQYDGKLYRHDENYVPPIRIRELEEVRTRNNTTRIGPYGYLHQNRDGIETAEELGYLKMGESNAWDGFIIYEVPKSAGVNDIIILAEFSSFGSAYWTLK